MHYLNPKNTHVYSEYLNNILFLFLYQHSTDLKSNTVFHTAQSVSTSKLYDIIKQTCFSLQISKDGYLAIKDNYKNNWTSSLKKATEFRIDLIIAFLERITFFTLGYWNV